ncbi:MAG TPA: nitroreductase family protein [Phycisphaerales bacterium]|nr:nitroreductase family protein [Phycisphaerales bacterium]
MNVRDIRVSEHRRADHPVLPIFIDRWSPRAMSGDPLTRDELDRLFEAARWAPSSYNEQPWRILYATRDSAHWPDFLHLLMDLNKAWCVNAGALFLFVSKKTFSHNGAPNAVHVFDCGSAWENLALQGASMGLVTHGMAGFDRDRARKTLHIPDDFEICAMAAAGKPGDTEDLSEAMRTREVPSGRKKIEEFTMEGPFKG